MNRLWFFLGLVTAVLCIVVLKFLHLLIWAALIVALALAGGWLLWRKR